MNLGVKHSDFFMDLEISEGVGTDDSAYGTKQMRFVTDSFVHIKHGVNQSSIEHDHNHRYEYGFKISPKKTIRYEKESQAIDNSTGSNVVEAPGKNPNHYVGKEPTLKEHTIGYVWKEVKQDSSQNQHGNGIAKDVIERAMNQRSSDDSNQAFHTPRIHS